MNGTLVELSFYISFDLSHIDAISTHGMYGDLKLKALRNSWQEGVIKTMDDYLFVYELVDLFCFCLDGIMEEMCGEE